MGIQERKGREKEQRREGILQAAERVFFEKGLQAATMDEIAEVAELSKGTLYLYYKSKEDLYLAVMLRGMSILTDMCRQTVAHGSSPIETIVRLLDTYYEFFNKHRQYFRMFYFFNNPTLHTQVTDEMRAHCNQHNQRIWSVVIDVFVKGIEEGMLRSDLSPVELGIILWFSIHAMLMRIDNESEQWKENMGIDLVDLREKQAALLLDAVATPEARKRYPHLFKIAQPTIAS